MPDVRRAPCSDGTAADLAHCRALIRHGSKSFHSASLLLPRRVRDPALAVYAFCRVADDAVDLGDDPAGAVDRLYRRLDRAAAGRPEPRPVDRALARVLGTGALPRALLEALIDGMAWDAAGRRYATLPELTAYAARVAGAVGAVMACLMGARSAAQLARATDLGVAMQFTNIARDVGEDARAGRLYLPLDWLAEQGVDPDGFLARPLPDPRVAALTARLLDQADALYRRADAGIDRLPADCRPAIAAARHLYAAIGARIARQEGDSISARAWVPGWRRLPILARATAARLPALWARPGHDAPALPEARFLVEAAALPGRTGTQGFGARLVWAVELFTEIERRDRLGRGGSSAA